MKDTNDRRIGRAGFLGVLAVGAAGIFLAEDAVNAVEEALPRGLRSRLPSRRWRIYTIGDAIPRLDPAAYRLRITGEVERETVLGLDDLRALPQTVHVADFHCVTGWTVDDVRWSGVRFEELLALARPTASGRYLQFVSAEPGYHDCLSLEHARLPGVMLGLGMEGRPLTSPHGFAARVVIPPMYGYKGVKWVEEIRVVSTYRPGYWEQHGYDRDAWVGRSNGHGV